MLNEIAIGMYLLNVLIYYILKRIKKRIKRRKNEKI